VQKNNYVILSPFPYSEEAVRVGLGFVWDMAVPSCLCRSAWCNHCPLYSSWIRLL